MRTVEPLEMSLDALVKSHPPTVKRTGWRVCVVPHRILK
jgi:hypothetical protein